MKLKKTTILIAAIFLMLIVVASVVQNQKNQLVVAQDRELVTQTGVCPPFNLYDEEGNLIDPGKGINSDRPFSPKQTCGKCHDYDKITQGFHFQQGKDEQAEGTFAERYQWVSTPGNYGGNWCSPAPLYNYLSKKENSSDREMDMTSFTFITNGCGTCHPGSGSLEYDRDGNRYDKFMEVKGYTAGATNNFDGDYYQAHWNRTGVIEGDCNLCHLPEYDYKGRNDHLSKWNFRWMATAGSGLAKVTGSVKDTVEVKVEYDKSKFTPDGKVAMHLVREPRNETCLNCHSKPQWKKRGASFTANTDVHIAKGIKCVDCHVAGSMATDERIKGKEEHQFGKGDDPSGNVRNDLDNTIRTCIDCHSTGYLNAPVARHNWLPSFHLDKLSCQACHIPERKVKSALVQASDVYNPGVKINPPAKYVWTFYDQNLNYWNHYGELNQFTAKDQPTDPFRPQYAKYKGQIFPVNSVLSAWPAIYTEGIKGLHQPKMKDIFTMWTTHRKDHTKYPDLALLKDDNNDSIPEVNSPAEIDAFINSVTAYMIDAGYELGERKIVWVNNDRIYFNGKEYQNINKEEWESSPYASVYKYSHDVFPAKAALGMKGCTNCHSTQSEMLFGQVVKYPFGDDGYPVYEPQYVRLGMTAFGVWNSAVREQYIKELQYPAFFYLLIIVTLSLLLSFNKKSRFIDLQENGLLAIYILITAVFALSFFKNDVRSMIIPDRLILDQNHFYIALVALAVSTFVWFRRRKEGKTKTLTARLQQIFIGFTVVSGFLILIKFEAIKPLVAIAYTLFDIGVVLMIFCSLFCLVKEQFKTIAIKTE